MDIVDPRIEAYMEERLRRFDEPVLLEMEAYGAEHGFPTVGRNVGVTLEVLARSVGPARIMELGSGYGYSAYWHARAVGPDGEVHLTDGDPGNERKAADYLGRAGLADRTSFHVGGRRHGDREARRRVRRGVLRHRQGRTTRPRGGPRERVRPGGLYVCDNVLWYGHVRSRSSTTPALTTHRGRPRAQRADREDERYVSTIVPTRDGVDGRRSADA